MSAGEFTGMGFAAGTVKGVRSFRVDKLGRLTGVNYRQVWRPETNDAECRKSESDTVGALYASLVGNVYQSHRALTTDWWTSLGQSHQPKPLRHAFESCQCGFYGYFDGSDDYHDEGMVTGVVEGFGETIIGTRGFRAMKARILALRVKPDHDGIPARVAHRLRVNYRGIPIFDTFEQMVAEFPADESLIPSPETVPDFWTREA